MDKGKPLFVPDKEVGDLKREKKKEGTGKNDWYSYSGKGKWIGYSMKEETFREQVSPDAMKKYNLNWEPSLANGYKARARKG
jgi:hypothetical protein